MTRMVKMSENAVPKIEGHATFYAHLRSGNIDEARVIGLDGERFVEKLLLGRKYFEAPIITSRICGICPVIHNVTSVKAVEDACQIKVSAQIKELRKLLLSGQMIQSHALHLYLLVLPDFVGASSSFELQNTHPSLFQNAIKLKHFADEIVRVVGGRAVHPVANVPGGFKSFPRKDELKKLINLAEESENLAIETLKLFLTFDYPVVSREMVYSALSSDKDYAFYDGDIKDTLGHNYQPQNYRRYIYEELVPYNRAKFGTLKGHVMMVGSMARYNLNREQFAASFLKELDALNIPKQFDNPFDNIVAQAIENYYFVKLAKQLIGNLSEEGIIEEELAPVKKFGKGTSACEAPRGTLFHHYELDSDGYITKADIITPTVQNLPSMEFDMKQLSPLLKNKSRDEINHLIETLIRGYDPCITCATH